TASGTTRRTCRPRNWPARPDRNRPADHRTRRCARYVLASSSFREEDRAGVVLLHARTYPRAAPGGPLRPSAHRRCTRADHGGAHQPTAVAPTSPTAAVPVQTTAVPNT